MSENKKENSEFKQRIRIKIKAFDHKIIDQSTKTIIETNDVHNSVLVLFTTDRDS